MTDDAEFGAPYPLRRLFMRRFLPAFLGIVVLAAALIGWGGVGLMQSIYLQIAQRRAVAIDTAFNAHVPEAWEDLRHTDDPAAVLATDAGRTLAGIGRGEARELGLSHLKIYNMSGLVLFSTDPVQIGTVDASAGFREAAGSGERAIVPKTVDDGTELYELYVPVDAVDAVEGGTDRVVFELYEPVAALDQLVVQAVVPAVGVPAAALLLLAFTLGRVVIRAQADIDERTRLLHRFRERLERLVSSSAVDASRRSEGGDRPASRRVEAAILYSDVRGFTNYSEQRAPEDVIAFLNRVLGLQVEIIGQHGGDVDKMIGDAVLAVFEGDERMANAVAAARAIQQRLADDDLPCGVGIGVYTGPVVRGAIGPETRMDFTVIGDAVNTAARLCSVAGAAEVVADAATLGQADDAGFGAVEEVSVKGKSRPLDVRRWRIVRPAPPS